MHWNTLKIVAVVSLLASPSAFAAIPDADSMDSRASTVEAPQTLQLADHRRYPNQWSNDGRPREARGDRHGARGDRHYDRRDRRPYYRGHPPRHYRGHPPRYFRGWPVRRMFRHWRRQH